MSFFTVSRRDLRDPACPSPEQEQRLGSLIPTAWAMLSAMLFPQ